MELEVLCQPDFEKSSHFSEATQLAHELVDYARSISDAINRANTPGASSRVIQELFVPRAEDLGFSSERKGLFTKYKTSRLRPDFYKSLGRGAGILLEVERGKTTDNNMDLLDYWMRGGKRPVSVCAIAIAAERIRVASSGVPNGLLPTGDILRAGKRDQRSSSLPIWVLKGTPTFLGVSQDAVRRLLLWRFSRTHLTFANGEWAESDSAASNHSHSPLRVLHLR